MSPNSKTKVKSPEDTVKNHQMKDSTKNQNRDFLSNVDGDDDDGDEESSDFSFSEDIGDDFSKGAEGTTLLLFYLLDLSFYLLIYRFIEQ